MSILRENTIRLKDAAVRLGVTYGTVTRWRTRPDKRGRTLEAVKLGGKWYTSIEALERYGLESQSQVPNSDRDRYAEKLIREFEQKYAKPGRLRAKPKGRKQQGHGKPSKGLNDHRGSRAAAQGEAVAGGARV